MDSRPTDPSVTIPSRLSRRIQRWRWQMPILALLVVISHQLVEHTWLIYLPRWPHFASQVMFYGVAGPVLAWWVLTFVQRRVNETEVAYQTLAQTYRRLNEANEQLAFLIRVNHRLAEADEEEEAMAAILELPREVIPAIGCSLVRFDERGQPLPVIYRGDLDPTAAEYWATRLADEKVRRACRSCVKLQADVTMNCPLLQSAPESVAASRVYCLPLWRGGREYGVLNLYLEDACEIDTSQRDLLMAMADEISLVLESQRLRSRELAMLHRLQQIRHASNLHNALTTVLESTVEALEVDGGLLYLAETRSGDMHLSAEAGQPLNDSYEVLRQRIGDLQPLTEPLVIGELAPGRETDSPHSLVVAPMLAQKKALGHLILWTSRANGLSRRHVRLAMTVATQAAQLVENHRLYVRAEYQAALAERARLAREIHDGLAQTLGYLKLRTAQISGWLQARELARAREALEQVRELIAAAYVDAREAIDGLHLRPREGGVDDWLIPLLEDFRVLSQIAITSNQPPPVHLSAEIHVQLARMVQEALSNVRKHSGATQSSLHWELDGLWLTLRITDNGQGFDPDDAPPSSRHGLRIMQERAELLNADFQISSRPGEGTEVLFRLPLQQLEIEEHHG